MRRQMKLALPLIVAVVSGCASMSEQQCQTVDWASQGLADGRAGQPASRIQDHREACAKTGVAPDEARWRGGHSEGVRSYCTPNSGWTNGVNNYTYRGACAGLDEGTFLRYHRAGQLVYRARQDLSQAQSKASRLEDDLRRASKEEDRRRLRDELQRVDRERGRLTALVVTLEAAGPPR